MKILKSITFIIIITLTIPMYGYAQQPTGKDNWANMGKNFEKSDRKTAIWLVTEFAKCSGFFQGSAKVVISQGDENHTAPLSESFATIFHDAAIHIWSKHGTEFTQIDEIVEENKIGTAVNLSLAYNGSVKEQKTHKEKMENCGTFLPLAKGIQSNSQNTEWK